MALVQVQEVMIDAYLLKYRGAAEAQHDLLAQALLQIADIESGGNASIPWIVDFDIRVHQIEGDTPDGDLPHRDMDRGIGERHLNDALPAILVHHPGNRGGFAVDGLYEILLPAVIPDLLPEIALRIHESHSHERNA